MSNKVAADLRKPNIVEAQFQRFDGEGEEGLRFSFQPARVSNQNANAIKSNSALSPL